MGRKRKEDNEKKVNVNLRIQKEIRDELKEKNINMSQIFEEKAKEILNK